MRVLKWKYDKTNKEWWTGESVAWANDGYTIQKAGDEYCLRSDWRGYVNYFKKLSSAKKVADLLENG